MDYVHGKVPDFGAIFMSNSETRKECLEWKIFGLPSSQAPFVKQVKDGMILFLFEFDKRRLYGVFKACSDGAINIVPDAYSSTGKQFPAQVKFKRIWKCVPIYENEFREAIKENYFARYKFNFGLSAEQVHSLLLLFSWKKSMSKVTRPPMTLPNITPVVDSNEVKNKNDDYMNNVLDFSRHSMGKERKTTKDDRFPSHWGIKEHLYDNRSESSTLIEQPGDGRPASNYDHDPVNSKHQVKRFCDEGSFMENHEGGNFNLNHGDYDGRYSGEVRRLGDNVKLLPTNWFENHHNLNRNSAISLGNNRSQEINNSLVQEPMPSDYSRLMRPWALNPSNSSFQGNPINSNPVPYDPDTPQFEHSSLFGVNQSPDFVNNRSPTDINVMRNIYPSVKNHSLQLHMQIKALSKDSYAASSPKKCNCISCIPDMPSSRPGYSENETCNNKEYRSLPSTNPSLATMPIERSETYSMGGNEAKGFSPNDKYNETSRHTQFDIRVGEKRNSVFSRLSGGPKLSKPNHNTLMGCSDDDDDDDDDDDSDDDDLTVDEIMVILHHEHNNWVKNSGQLNIYLTKFNARESPSDERYKATSKPIFENESTENVDYALIDVEAHDSTDQSRPIVNFKRRSQIRKRDCVLEASSNSKDDSSRAQPKKRKLVRPDFGNIDGVHDSLNNQLKKKRSPDLSSVKENSDSLVIDNNGDPKCEAKMATKSDENEAIISVVDDDNKNEDSKCEAEMQQEGFEKDIVKNTENVHIVSHCAELQSISQASSEGNLINNNEDPKNHENKVIISGVDEVNKNEDSKCEAKIQQEGFEKDIEQNTSPGSPVFKFLTVDIVTDEQLLMIKSCP